MRGMVKERLVANPLTPALRLLNGTERLEALPHANPFAKAEHEGKAEKQEEVM